MTGWLKTTEMNFTVPGGPRLSIPAWSASGEGSVSGWW